MNWSTSLRIVSCCMLSYCGLTAELWAESHAIVPGYERFRSSTLTSVAAGQLLISELNCQSCHGTLDGQILPPRQAPILTEVSDRIAVQHLKAFLADPQSVKPGTAMPTFAQLSSTDDQFSTAVEALASFLASESSFRFMAVGGDAIRRGEKSFHGLGCAACHGDQRQSADQRPSFVMPLGDLSTKYSLGTLTTFLLDPHAVRPSGRMPSLNLSPEEVRDIASYLLKNVDESGIEANIAFEEYHGVWEQLPDFSQLTPVAVGRTTDFTVQASSRRDTFALRFSGFLQIPRDGEYRLHLSSDDGSRLLIDGQPVLVFDGVHAAGQQQARHRMKAGPHELTVEYFEFYGEESLTVEISGNGMARQPLAGLVTAERDAAVPQDSVPETDPGLVAQGRELFASLGCAACHQHGVNDQQIRWTRSAPTFPTLNAAAGCLSVTPSSGVPVFALTTQQRQDITAAITASRSDSAAVTREHSIAQIMTTLNCYACHERDAMGGVPTELNELFTGTIPEMGDEGRIPPHLTSVGDKLNPDWLKHVLNAGAKDRPYMSTRMPKFGANNVGQLLSLLQKDQKTEVANLKFSEPVHRVQAEARLMIGDQALSCIKCHTFDKFAATGLQSIDMTTMTQRLRRDWFHRYLLNPQAYRPGTRMPAAWPNGRSVVPHILDGTAATQIEAMWMYLLDGKQARIPSGLQTEAIELTAQQQPLIYRNFIEGLSPRGIAVAFPEKAHFAFDAEHMNVRLIWHGAFLDASKHWVGRGPGFQSPLGDHALNLSTGPAVAKLTSAQAAWPSASARDLGYQFKGYRLDESGVPTFRYETADGIQVFDRIAAQPAEPDAELIRHIRLSSPSQASEMFVRIARGQQIERMDDGWVIDRAIHLRQLSCEPQLRTVDGQQELIVPVPMNQSQSAELTYTIRW